MSALRVGVIGASAQSGWARESHIPAVQGLEGLELVAVATQSQATADEAAKAFGALKAFADGRELVRDPDVDVVTVATRVQDHRALVLEALAAGKHVYSEWPLGRSTAEAEEMAEAAGRAGVHTAIGLQLRESATVREAGRLIASGAIGRLLGLRVVSTTAGFGPDVPPPFAYLEEPENFANLVTIQGAHTMDLCITLAGGLESLDSLPSRQFPEIRVGDPAETRRRTTFDHLMVQGVFGGGATLSLETAGGRPPPSPFRLDATGETGVVSLVGGGPRGAQAGRLRLEVDGVAREVDEGPRAGLPDTAANVAGVYARLRDDIRSGGRTVTGFDHAVALTRLTEALIAAPDRGALSSGDWPQR